MRTSLIVLLASLSALAIITTDAGAQNFLYSRATTIYPGVQPKNLGYNPARRKMYCTVSDTVLGVIDAAYSYSKIGGFGSEWTEHLAYNQSKDVIYTCGTYDVFSVDCQTNAIKVVGASLSEGFNGLVFNSSNNRLYVDGGGVHVIGGATDTLLKSFVDSTGRNQYSGPLFLYRPTNDVYAVKYTYDSLFINIIDTLILVIRDTTVIDSVHAPPGFTSQSCFGANEARGRVYITIPDSDYVYVMNASTHAISGPILTPADPMKMAYCPATDEVYLACWNTGLMSYIDGATDSISYIVLDGTISDSITAIAYNPFIQKIYAADGNDGRVYIIDPATHTKMATVMLDTSGISHPVDMAVGDSGKVFVSSQWTNGVQVVAWQDTTIPVIWWTSPYDSATDVSFDEPVQIGFSEPMDPASFSVNITPSPGGWSVAWDGSRTVATIQHANFAPGSTYRCSVAAARDQWGNNLTGFRAWRFYTKPLDYLTTYWTRGRYKLFSVPLKPYDSLATALLGDNLGSYGQDNWRLFGYNPQTSSTVELPPIKNGRGYWLSSVDNCTLDVSGDRLLSIPVVNLPLAAGWNLIGHPFEYPMGIDSCTVFDTAYFLYSNPAANNILRQRLWVYTDNSADFVNNGSWDIDTLTPLDPADSLRPWQGYAAFAVSACTLQIGTMPSKAAAEGGPQPKAMIDWSLYLAAQANGAIDQVCLGSSAQAMPGYDRLDWEKPPAVSDEVRLYFPHSDWGTGTWHEYGSDFRPAGDVIEWPLALKVKNSAPTKVEYRLSGALPPGYRLFLAEGSSGKAFELGDRGTLAFEGSRDLAVVLTDRGLEGMAFTPLAFGLSAPRPNPARQLSRIDYQLPRAGQARLELFNVLGQKVASLADGYHYPGYYSVRWDGTDGRGRCLPAGVYLVRLTSDGSQAVRKLVRVQ